MSLDAGDIVRLAVGIEGPQEQLIYNVLHYLATTGTGADEATVLASLASNYETALADMAASVHSSYETFGATLWQWDTTLKKMVGIASQALSTFVGTSAGDVLQAQSAPQVDFFVSTPKRQGRKYLFGITESGQTGGSWTGSVLAAIALYAADVLASVVSDGVTFVPGVFSVDDASPYYETFEAFGSTIGIETYASTQRRRKPGVGI